MKNKRLIAPESTRIIAISRCYRTTQKWNCMKVVKSQKEAVIISKGSCMKVVLFLLIIRIMKEIRTTKTRRQADCERLTIGVRILSLKSSHYSANFN